MNSTSECVEIRVLGEPVAKGRPRVTKSGVTFTPGKTRRWEQVAALLAQEQMAGRAVLDGPLEVTVVAEWEVPASWPKWKTEMARDGGVAHTSRPDLDNVAKAAVDALNGVVFRDDSQIVSLIVHKRYGVKPGLVIRVAEMDALPAQAKRKQGSA